ncbi:MAG: sugar phosphate isomerase/epimerase [Fuerstiella sp.]|nr:sugar phosphate isomerase/epimerase [Fuerstiella sp.]
MQLGVFAKTFVRDSPEENLDAVCQYGFECTQYNFVCAGLPTLPNKIDAELCERVRVAHVERGLTMAAVSGTFNIIHPDRQLLQANLKRLDILAHVCRQLNTRLITLCTGTRDPQNMWRAHPENDSPAAWNDMLTSMRQIVNIAEASDVMVGIEPEINNVVNSALKARRLLDQLNSPVVKIVMDPANLFQVGQSERMHQVMDDAFRHLSSDIAVAHAKDLSDDADIGYSPAGKGILDYDYFLKLLDKYEFNGALITHGLSESQVPECVRFLHAKLDRTTEINH